MHRTMTLLKRMDPIHFQLMNHCLTKHLTSIYEKKKKEKGLCNVTKQQSNSVKASVSSHIKTESLSEASSHLFASYLALQYLMYMRKECALHAC